MNEPIHIALAAGGEIFPIHAAFRINFGEIATDDFIKWYQWRLATNPNEQGTPLADFDLLSVMDIFEDWVIEKNK